MWQPCGDGGGGQDNSVVMRRVMCTMQCTFNTQQQHYEQSPTTCATSKREKGYIQDSFQQWISFKTSPRGCIFLDACTSDVIEGGSFNNNTWEQIVRKKKKA